MCNAGRQIEYTERYILSISIFNITPARPGLDLQLIQLSVLNFKDLRLDVCVEKLHVCKDSHCDIRIKGGSISCRPVSQSCLPTLRASCIVWRVFLDALFGPN